MVEEGGLRDLRDFTHLPHGDIGKRSLGGQREDSLEDAQAQAGEIALTQ